ncbi:transposable element Tcb2 transposase [Trichonephila clavipes]|nr:transposable element Tcb2 transposase [Trichonephila clavipes]
MSFTRRPGSGLHRQTSRREDRRIVRNARVKSTASSVAIQAQVAPSLGAPVSSQTLRRRLVEGHLGSWNPLRMLLLSPLLPINASGWSSVAHEETEQQWNGTKSSLATRIQIQSQQ